MLPWSFSEEAAAAKRDDLEIPGAEIVSDPGDVPPLEGLTPDRDAADAGGVQLTMPHATPIPVATRTRAATPTAGKALFRRGRRAGRHVLAGVIDDFPEHRA